jgi:hypothetical protein
MADKQPAPQEVGDTQPGSLWEAQEALLKMMEPEEETPETEEAQPTEEEESQPIEEDESLEEEPEEESEEEDDEGTDEEAEEDLLYAVTVNGAEQEVSLDELMKGYSRQSDYTRKTQEVSEQRKEFDAMKQNMVQEYQQIQAERQQYAQALQSLMEGNMSGIDKFANVDWEVLKEADPIEYVTRKEEFREAQEKVQNLQREQHMAQQRHHAQSQNEHRQMLQQETTALVTALPDWGDSSKQPAIAKNIRSYAMENGFTQEELDSLVDHRSILVLLKAQKYDQLQNSDVRGKKLKNKPRVIRSGTGGSKKSDSKSKRAVKMKRLQSTGHVDDAASILEDMFNS